MVYSLGGAHSGVIDSDGEIWTWGKNEFGQLGDGNKGDEFDSSTPTSITKQFFLIYARFVSDIDSLSATLNYTLIPGNNDIGDITVQYR